MQIIKWSGHVTCLQGNISQLSESDCREIIRDVSNGIMKGITTLGALWEVRISFDPQCNFADLDKASRKLLIKTMLCGNQSGTITSNVLSYIDEDANSILRDKNDVNQKSGNNTKAIPVRVSRDTFNNILATLTALYEDVRYAARAKKMVTDIADNAVFSTITSICVCLLTLEEIQELLELLSCNNVCPEMDFYQLISDKQESLSR